MPLGRWPNEDFALIYQALSETTFVYDHDRPDRWTEATAPWVNGYWRYLWANKYLPVTAIDTVANVFTIADRPGYPIATGRFWYGLNLLDEVDLPGEWYPERNPDAPEGTYGKLYLWPPDKLDTAEIMLSLRGGDGSALVRLDSVRHVRFEGLTFELTRGDGIVIENSRDVVIDRCVLRNIGGQGITTDSCTRVGVLNSELYGIGSEAVRLSGGDRRTLTPGGNYVRNCHVDFTLFFSCFPWETHPFIFLINFGVVGRHTKVLGWRLKDERFSRSKPTDFANRFPLGGCQCIRANERGIRESPSHIGGTASRDKRLHACPLPRAEV